MAWLNLFPYRCRLGACFKDQGPVVQSVVSLTSSLRVISLTVLADSIYNILIFFCWKMWEAFALQKLLTLFSAKNFSNICVSLDVNFNESLTNDVVSFEQLGPYLISCRGNTGRMLHGICRYAMVVLLRRVNRGPWAFFFFFLVLIWASKLPSNAHFPPPTLRSGFNSSVVRTETFYAHQGNILTSPEYRFRNRESR